MLAGKNPEKNNTEQRDEERSRLGFLPIETNAFDRIFISIVCLIAIHLLWMRLLEAMLPLWIATIISLILSAIIVRYG